jgi:hypothetical protein
VNHTIRVRRSLSLPPSLAALTDPLSALTSQVDLDLSPHTTLAKAGRDYAHNCFHLPGLTLAPGNYVGISGLASAYTEPDTIDVYAVSPGTGYAALGGAS